MKSPRIVVLGGTAVGKSSLISRFLNDKFEDKHRPTLEDLYEDIVQLPSGLFRHIEFIDACGTNDFPAMRERCIRSASGLLVVYAVDDPSSFQEAQNIYMQIVNIIGLDVPIAFIGNKIDLLGCRRVTTENGMQMAKSKNIPFIEVTAKCNLNVKCVFYSVLQSCVCKTSTINQKQQKKKKKQ